MEESREVVRLFWIVLGAGVLIWALAMSGMVHEMWIDRRDRQRVQAALKDDVQ